MRERPYSAATLTRLYWGPAGGEPQYPHHLPLPPPATHRQKRARKSRRSVTGGEVLLERAQVGQRRVPVEDGTQVATIVLAHAGIHELLLEDPEVGEGHAAVAVLIHRAHTTVDTARVGAVGDEVLKTTFCTRTRTEHGSPPPKFKAVVQTTAPLMLLSPSAWI